MATKTKPFNNPAYLQSSTTMLLFFASWGIWWSFFQIWLDTSLGFTGEQIGIVFSANSLGTLIIMFLYGTLQDRLGVRRHLAILIATVSVLMGPFAIWVYEPLLRSNFWLGVVIGSIVISAGFVSGVGLLEALSERLSRRYGFEYGQARMWGSFGYAMVALVAGFLFSINPHINFWGGSAFGVLLLLVTLFWKTDHLPILNASDDSKQPGIKDMVATLKLPSLWVIIAFVIMTWTFYQLFDQQMFPAWYTSLFESEAVGQRVYGTLNSAQVFAEAAMMGVVPLVMRKVGVRNALLMGVSVMAIRILGCATFTDPVIVSGFKMLHAIEVPLFVLPIFRYITLHFTTLLSATLYMVGFQIAAQVGNVLLSQPLGRLRDAIGYQPTFHVIVAVVVVAGIFAFFALKKDDEQVLGDPFERAPRKGRKAASIAGSDAA